MSGDYPDFRIPISLAQQEVDLDMIIKACNVVLNTAIQTCEATISTVIEAVNVVVNTQIIGQTVDLTTIIEACNVVLDINLKTCEATINQIITGQTIDITQIINGQNVGVYDRRDWASKEAEFKTWGVLLITFAGQTEYADLYTVPAGKIIFLTDVQAAAKVAGLTRIYTSAGVYLTEIRHDMFTSVLYTISTPLTIPAGVTLQCSQLNEDIQGGEVLLRVIIWEQPASEPDVPKNDSPEELYRTGTFNYCQVIKLPDGEQLFLFKRHKDKIVNYLKYKDYSRPGQKKLASFKMEAQEVEDIINTINVFPKKVKEVLEKYEEKYKPK